MSKEDLDTVIVRSHNVVFDVRVRKIVKSLSKKYSVFSLGWNRSGITNKNTQEEMVNIDLFNLRAPLGRPTLLAYLPIFWVWVFVKLISLNPKVIHACDFDTVMPCYLYKIIFRKKLVFDVFDRYAMANIPQKYKMLHSFVMSIEESYGKHSDVLITVGENVLQTFKRKPKHFKIILNSSEDHPVKRNNKDSDLLTLVYTGAVVKNRGIERIIAAIKGLDRVELVVAGWVIDNSLLDELMKIPAVKYKGVLQPAEALTLEGNSDVMIILYDLKIQNHNFANPNKTFEAMMLGLPIITNITPNIIQEEKCGIMVDYEDLEQIKSSIISLRDNLELRKELGNSGRRAYEKKYDWKRMEQDLYEIYDVLLKKRN